jgi:hypothetical protein
VAGSQLFKLHRVFRGAVYNAQAAEWIGTAAIPFLPSPRVRGEVDRLSGAKTVG